MDIHDRTSSKRDTASANIKPRVSFIPRRGTKCIEARHVMMCRSLVDFGIGLVDSDHHLPDGQVKLFWELKLQNYCKAFFFLTSK